MIKIPLCIREDYLGLEKIKNFCLEHDLNRSANKVDLLNNMLEYAGDDSNRKEYREVYHWILNAIKEGSKDICYKKIYHNDLDMNTINKLLLDKYPSCPKKDILSYKNGKSFGLVNYNIEIDDHGNPKKVCLLFSKIVLEGKGEGNKGNLSIYPIYIDIYLEEGFITSRAQAKTTIYDYGESDVIYKNTRINTINEALKLIDNTIKIFHLEEDGIGIKMKNKRLLFRLYKEFSSTPEDIINKIQLVNKEAFSFIKDIFKKLSLDPRNIPKAHQDIEIFLEKYVSINGNMEKIFKDDREAYLIRVSSDDTAQLSRIDTSSAMYQPLQCTEIFYDGKKSTMRSQECERLTLCFNRKQGYLGQFTVRFEIRENFGIIKTKYYPEECDIQNVLQKVFRYY